MSSINYGSQSNYHFKILWFDSQIKFLSFELSGSLVMPFCSVEFFSLENCLSIVCCAFNFRSKEKDAVSSFFCLSVFLCIILSVWSVCLSIYLFIHLPLHIHLSLCPSICLMSMFHITWLHIRRSVVKSKLKDHLNKGFVMI